MKKDNKPAVTGSVMQNVEKSLQIAAARQQFFEAAISMSWQLAVTIVVPVIIGVKLDDRYHTTPSYTLAALFLAVFIACGVVWKTIHGLTVAQVEGPKSKTKKGSRS